MKHVPRFANREDDSILALVTLEGNFGVVGNEIFVLPLFSLLFVQTPDNSPLKMQLAQMVC